MKRLALILTILSATMLLPFAAPAHAQASRTWVSGVGDDVNPCSRTAPCKTFAGAISKTAVGGEISVLDPGGFGAVTIVKSISIVADGSEGSVSACGNNAIIINAPNGVVNLHGLFLEGCGNNGSVPGLSGIRVINAASVHIRKTVIRGFTANVADSYGLDVENTAPTRVYVSDSTISNNRRGVGITPTGNVASNVTLDNVKVENNSIGIRAAGASTSLWLNNSVITNNNTGLVVVSGASVTSFGNNVISNNNTDGSPTATIGLR